MAWLAVDKNGFEAIFKEKPYRMFGCVWESTSSYAGFQPGSIKKLIGRELTWSDEPVELK